MQIASLPRCCDISLQKDFDYASDQQLLHDYYQAFQQVDKIIKRDDGTLPDFWLTMMRDWLLGEFSLFGQTEHRLMATSHSAMCVRGLSCSWLLVPPIVIAQLTVLTRLINPFHMRTR